MKNLALFSGWIVFLALHLFRLAQVPGLHFDEAWAFTHARSIAQGGFTLKAMSPYTMPWTHYWAALFLWFSNSLWAFRFSQIVLAFGGLAFVHFSLSTERRVWLPWILLLIPGLFFNHRFAIELNGLHVFTFGLGLWALQQGRFGLAAFAWVLGTTAHILFYPWGLAVCAAYLGEGNALTEHHRRTLRWSAFVFFIFFTSVVLQIPEKGKGLALCFSALSIGVFTYVDKLPQTIALGGVSKKVLPLVAIPFLANAIFFGQGSWSYATQTGILLWEKTYYLLFLFLPFAVYFVWRGLHELSSLHRQIILWAAVGIGLIVLKPTPRYYETLILALALVVLASRAFQRSWVLTLGLLHAALLYPSYFFEVPVEREVRLLFWKDSSADFLSKQRLVAVLGDKGCPISVIRDTDSRTFMSLQALSLSDWPIAERVSCPWRKVRLVRQAQEPVQGQVIDDYWLQEVR